MSFNEKHQDIYRVRFFVLQDTPGWLKHWKISPWLVTGNVFHRSMKARCCTARAFTPQVNTMLSFQILAGFSVVCHCFSRQLGQSTNVWCQASLQEACLMTDIKCPKRAAQRLWSHHLLLVLWVSKAI